MGALSARQLSGHESALTELRPLGLLCELWDWMLRIISLLGYPGFPGLEASQIHWEDWSYGV